MAAQVRYAFLSELVDALYPATNVVDDVPGQRSRHIAENLINRIPVP
jgi:hypothetical protein